MLTIIQSLLQASEILSVYSQCETVTQIMIICAFSFQFKANIEKICWLVDYIRMFFNIPSVIFIKGSHSYFFLPLRLIV